MPSSAAGSGETSRAEPTRPRSEAELLDREAADARAAFAASLGELRNYCTTENAVRRWMDRHPWLTLAAASAAGVALARAATAPERASPPPAAAHQGVEADEPPAQQAAAAPPWWLSLVTPLAPMLISIVEDTIRSLISGKMRGGR